MVEKEWLNEPNRVEFIYEGYECLIIRHPHLGSLSGYVGIPEDSDYFGAHYDLMNSVESNLHVHGGLTYSSEGCSKEERDMFYYKPTHNREKKKLWWVGFDCAHAGDLVPFLEFEKRRMRFLNPELWKKLDEMENSFPYSSMFKDTYKNMDFVSREIRQLVDQIKVEKDRIEKKYEIKEMKKKIEHHEFLAKYTKHSKKRKKHQDIVASYKEEIKKHHEVG